MKTKIGIFFDLRNPNWCQRPWAQHYADSLDVIDLAEVVGLDSIWLSEHHLFEDGYLSQPLVLAAAIAARTKQIRIGTGVLLGALRPPILISEEAILVDIISNGRLELGFGAGYRKSEFDIYNADFKNRFKNLETCLVEVRRHFHESKSPGAVQPDIPLWLGYGSANGAKRAGMLGVGLLSLDRSLLNPYLDGLSIGGFSSQIAKMGGLIDLVVTHDPERVRTLLRPHILHQLATYQKYRFEPQDIPEHKKISQDYIDAVNREDNPIGTQILTPEQAISYIQARIDLLPASDIYCWASIAGMPNDIVREHVSLLGSIVKPAIQLWQEEKI